MKLTPLMFRRYEPDCISSVGQAHVLTVMQCYTERYVLRYTFWHGDEQIIASVWERPTPPRPIHEELLSIWRLIALDEFSGANRKHDAIAWLKEQYSKLTTNTTTLLP